jgi:transcriptional regulator with XRE-family HTH domain
MKNDTIGQRISRFRKERGITQLQLAQKLKVDQTLISAYEKDTRRIHSKRLAELAKILSVKVNILLGFSDTEFAMNKPCISLARRMRKIERLSPNRKKWLLRTIDRVLKNYDRVDRKKKTIQASASRTGVKNKTRISANLPAPAMPRSPTNNQHEQAVLPLVSTTDGTIQGE